jgi:hypothetical protein
MRRLLTARGAPAAAVGILAGLIAGGYALASGGSDTIHACVHRHGGGIYIANKCAKRDRRISWNQAGPTGPRGAPGAAGPPGPGATSLVYNATSSTSPTRTTIGTIGPWTVAGLCTRSGNTTTTEIDLSGPGFQGDGFNDFDMNTSTAVSATNPGPISNAEFAATNPTATQTVGSGQFLLTPISGSPIELFATVVAAGGSAPSGATPNSCHFAATITPVAAAPGSAARELKPGRASGPLLAER